MQDEEGVDSVEVDDLHEFLPGANGAGIAYALFEPDSGFADPVATTRAYVDRRVAGPGARALEGTPVEAIEVAGGARARRARRRRARRVRQRRARRRRVVGASSRAAIGLELPLEITREQDVVFATAPEPAIPCAVSSQADRIYMRPAPEHGEGHVLVGRGFPKDYEHGRPGRLRRRGRRGVRGGRARARRSRGCRASPGMRAVGGRVGLYDVTPDWHPLLGPVDGLRRAAPRDRRQRPLLQARPRDRRARRGRDHRPPAPFADLATFSLSRFAEGRELTSSYGGNRA